MKTSDILLDILKDGAVQVDTVYKRLVQSQGLGFGVRPEDVVIASLLKGAITTFSDGGKSWARIAAPFVSLERGNDWGCDFLAYQAKDGGGGDWIKNAINARQGETIDIKWPDGSIAAAVIELRVQEFGALRPWEPLATEVIPGVMIVYHGASAWIPLDHPGLQVRADQFTTRP